MVKLAATYQGLISTLFRACDFLCQLLLSESYFQKGSKWIPLVWPIRYLTPQIKEEI